jgi:hypothetical protein
MVVDRPFGQERRGMRDRDTSSYTHEVRELGHGLSPSDLRQIDAWIDRWFDTDTRFGRANACLGALGALGGLVWAVVSAVTGGITFGSAVLMPIFAFFAGGIAGAFAVVGASGWLVWKVGAWVVGLF